MKNKSPYAFSVHNSETSYDSAFFLSRLHEFIKTGQPCDLKRHTRDPLCNYLLETMTDSKLRNLVFGHESGPRIFIDTLMSFVALYLQKMNYYSQRWGAELRDIESTEEWSQEKRKQDWASLLQELEKSYAEQGLSISFYKREFEQSPNLIDDALWNNLMEEWRHHFNLRFKLQKKKFIEERGEMQTRLLTTNLISATSYIEERHIPLNDFCQTWALMGGRWNALEFERLHRITKLQAKYPVLPTIANRMGRIADKDGAQRIGTTSGRNEKMEHTSKSDIAGISLGRELSSLLPSEMAQFLDNETEDVFLQKYVTSHLQTFSHQSKVVNAARSLQTQSARHKGPIVVCVDTSGSMMGEPFQVSLSLMMRLAEMSEQENRPCFLIAFSTQAHPIDVLKDRPKLLQFFTRKASGNTDACRMLNSLFQLLNSNTDYVCADILWITDFRIPIPPATYLQQMEQLRQSGTHFYGLQIGIAENHWTPYFEEIFSIEDIKMSII